MTTEQNPPLHFCTAPMLAALDAHRHWLANLQCLRQVQLQADKGLLEADDAFGAELANAPSFNAVFTSQLAFINRQLAVQHLIWQGWLQMGARGPAAWAEQCQCAEKAWQHVFSDTLDASSNRDLSAWEVWGNLTRSAMDAANTLSGETGRTLAQRLASLQTALVGPGSEKP